MKIKNIKVGDYIESKNIHGGDKVYPILKTGEKYKVLEIDEDMHELPIMIAVPGHKIFGDGFWVHPKNFRKPKLKVLDQSVFDGLDEKWRYAAIDSDGSVRVYNYIQIPIGGNHEPDPNHSVKGYEIYELIGTGYDTTNWQNSLIERESKELTGKELVGAMLDNGKNKVLVRVSSTSDKDIKRMILAFARKQNGEIVTNNGNTWEYMIAINVDDKPLTAKEAGL